MAQLQNLPLSSTFATLDVANTHKSVQSAFNNNASLKRLLIDIFHDASSASAEAATLVLQRDVTHISDAERVANIIKSFAGAVPRRNICALAQLAVFLAVSFDSSVCIAPLNCFSYTHSSVKRLAISTLISRLRHEVNHHGKIHEILPRIFPFFEHIVADHDPSIQRDAIHAITSLPDSVSSSHVSAFLNQLPLSPSPYSAAFEDNTNEENQQDDHDVSFETFLTITIARGVVTSSSPISNSTAPSFHSILQRVLLRSVDLNTADMLYELQAAHPRNFANAVSCISLDIFLFILSLQSASFASRGHLSACMHLLSVAHAVVSDNNLRRKAVHPVVVAVVSIVTTSVVSLASVAAADKLGHLAAELFQHVVSDCRQPYVNKNNENNVLDNVTTAITAALQHDCPAALSILSFLRALVTRWLNPISMTTWLSQDIVHLMQTSYFTEDGNKKYHDENVDVQSRSQTQSFVEAVQRQNVNQYIEEDRDITAIVQDPSIDHSSSRLFVAIVTHVALFHTNPRVRLCAADALAKFPDATAMLFCLPATMVQLREERYPAVAIRLLQDVIVSEHVLCHRETASIALRSILRILKSVSDKSSETFSSSLTQTILVAIAKASKHAPGPVTKILLMELESIRVRFDATSPALRVAGAAAVSTLVSERPARGSKFVPFITCCIDRSSVDVAPDAAAICLDAMYSMCENEVMDPIKTVKIVMKKLPSISTLNDCVRRSFLRLVGTVADGDIQSKKGRAVTESVIELLRKCVTVYVPQSTTGMENKDASNEVQLSWPLVTEAAKSLARFSEKDVLRIAFSHEDPLVDLEAERARLEKIEEKCGIFVDEVLNNMKYIPSNEGQAYKALQKLVNKIAKHEWEERPRGNFDPERIARLYATSNALRRSRKRIAVNKNQAGNTVDMHEDEQEESIQEQFAHAVHGMPVGVIRTLCARSADLDPHAILAAAEAGAVTSALPWPTLIDEWLKGGAVMKSKLDVKNIRSNEEDNDKAWAAALCALRLGQCTDEADMNRIRGRWFAPEDFYSCGPKQAVEIFMGCVTLFSDRLSQAFQFIRRSEIVCALIDAVHTRIGNKEEQLRAMECLLSVIDEMETVDEDKGWDASEFEKVEHELTTKLPKSVMQVIWNCRLTKARVRLVCGIGEGGAVRVIASEVVRNQNVMCSEKLLCVVGKAVAHLRLGARQGLICEMAEQPSIQGATVVCHGLGASAWLPNIGDALVAALSLCETGERLAVQKLAEFVSDISRK